MTGLKKAAPDQESGYLNTQENHSISLVNSYHSALGFYRKRATYHQQCASWYFNHARLMQTKAGQHLDFANEADKEATAYLELIAMAYKNGFSFHPAKGVSHAR